MMHGSIRNGTCEAGKDLIAWLIPLNPCLCASRALPLVDRPPARLPGLLAKSATISSATQRMRHNRGFASTLNIDGSGEIARAARRRCTVRVLLQLGNCQGPRLSHAGARNRTRRQRAAGFWNVTDLARKLAEFRDYYTAHRVHRSLDGTTPTQRAGAPPAAPAPLNQYAWRLHCRGLFQTPVAA